MEDPKRIIEDGYDRIGPQYRPWSDEAMPDDVRGEYVKEALSRLAAGADVLELGCGPGGGRRTPRQPAPLHRRRSLECSTSDRAPARTRWDIPP